MIFQSPIRTVFSRFLDLDRNLGIVKEKPTRKTCFSRKKKRPAPRIYQAKFCLVVFLWSQRNLYYIFTRNRDQVYSYTQVSTRVNTSQHESTQVSTNQHEFDTNQHESDTSQHESRRAQHKSTQINTSPTRVNTNQHESKTSLDHKK